MSGFRKPELRREQIVLWSQRLEDALPLDHPVRLFDQLLHAEPFATTFREWERDDVLFEGKPPQHPRDLTALYLYGMMNHLRSSRQLEAACWNRLDLIWLMQCQHPDHATMAGCVKQHGKRLRKLFRDVVRVGLRAKLIKLEHVTTDGTMIEADAGRGSVRSEEKIEAWLGHVDADVAALEAEWTANETREASLFGDDVCWAAATSEAAVRAARGGQVLTEAQWAALPRDASKRLAKSAFVYDERTDAYRCPAGHALPLLTTHRSQRGWGTAVRKRYGFTPYGRKAKPRGEEPCGACPRAEVCCRDPAKGRRIERDQYEEYRERMRERMNCDEGRAVYKCRRETVEPRIGWLKQGLGLRRFMRRGLEKVRTEWSLACTAANISILLRCWEKVVGVLSVNGGGVAGTEVTVSKASR